MTFAARLLAPTRPRADLNPLDDRYYSSYTPPARSGVTVTEDAALAVGTVWACVRAIMEPLSALPLITYHRLSDTDRERAATMPLYRILRWQPNAWQTSVGWRKQMMVHLLLRGNGISKILPGPAGPVDQLVPVHSDRITEVTQRSDLTLAYHLKNADGTRETLLQDEVLHVRGLSLDGFLGVSPVTYARETIGLGIAAEQYAARFYSQNSTPPIALVHPGKLTRAARQNIRGEWEADLAGLGNSHRVGVLADGMKPEIIGMSHQDSQFLETRQFGVEEIARWFNVPLHKIQSTSKETSWGSGIEQMNTDFVTSTLFPWATEWEQAITRDLILYPDYYYAEFLFDAFSRATLSDRFQAYHLAISDGWMSRNQARNRENMNSEPGLDEYLVPLNMGPAGGAAFPAGSPAPANAAGASREQHYRLLLTETAGQIVRRETLAMARAAKRCGDDQAAWRQAVVEFYNDHAAVAAEKLCLPVERLADYIMAQRQELETAGPEAMDDWQMVKTRELAGLAAREAGL